MHIGLRIDVDTLRGTSDGVPRLCRLLAEHSIQASFFFSAGPDNMGRHLWRLMRPTFLRKMLRTRAASLYGWDILIRGTLWPGPIIGEKSSAAIRRAADDGHEIGIHAWDHHSWQARIGKMNLTAIQNHLSKGVEMLERITGAAPACSAAPAWKSTDQALLAKCKFPFEYNSDCRGESIFRPVVEGTVLAQPQIPTTLPTYDEAIGMRDISDNNFNEYILSLLGENQLNVLTVHAEVEGIARADLFRRFIETARSRGVTFAPLGTLLEPRMPIDPAILVASEVAGRDGWISRQASLDASVRTDGQ